MMMMMMMMIIIIIIIIIIIMELRFDLWTHQVQSWFRRPAILAEVIVNLFSTLN